MCTFCNLLRFENENHRMNGKGGKCRKCRDEAEIVTTEILV